MKKIFLICLASFLAGLFFPTDFVFASTTGVIDPTHKYAWGEKIGWINFGCSDCNVRVTDSGLTGYAWSENYGWINLSPTMGGVNNNGEGILSGHAWGESLGWINFDGVQINSSGVFLGIASGSVSDQISFNCSQCQVRTDWRPRSARAAIVPTPPPSPSGGGGLLPEAYNLPKAPEGGFRVLINNDVIQTDSRKIILALRGGPDTRTVWISENPQFPEGFQVLYNPSLPQILASFSLSEGEGLKTIYAKFCTSWGQCSNVVSDDIAYQKPFIERAREILKPLVPEFLRPRLPEEVAVEELIPREAPPAFQGKWQLLSSELIEEFVLAPLPKEIKRLAQKFPELGETLEKVGVARIVDIQKLKTVELTLPGLTERLGLPTWRIQPGELALPRGVPVAELSPEVKEKIPTEIVFAKTAGELIDFNIDLTIGEKGEVQQKITTISGKPLQLVVKPDQPVENIRGYVVLKSSIVRHESRIMGQESKIAIRDSKFLIQNFATSLIFANPVFAQPRNKPVRAEERFVLTEFEYVDPDGDGIYIAEIQTPLVEGEYEIITVMDFEDPELGKREIRLITLIDPEGYIYERDDDKETRIPGATVSIYWLNPGTKQYELWPADEYQQKNPQITDVRGTYSFLVPEGLYYLEVTAPGYLEYNGKPFEVKEGRGVHINIELKPEHWWLEIVDWKTILLIAAIILLLYNFYRDKTKEELLKKHQANLCS